MDAMVQAALDLLEKKKTEAIERKEPDSSVKEYDLLKTTLELLAAKQQEITQPPVKVEEEKETKPTQTAKSYVVKRNDPFYQLYEEKKAKFGKYFSVCYMGTGCHLISFRERDWNNRGKDRSIHVSYDSDCKIQSISYLGYEDKYPTKVKAEFALLEKKPYLIEHLFRTPDFKLTPEEYNPFFDLLLDLTNDYIKDHALNCKIYTGEVTTITEGTLLRIEVGQKPRGKFNNLYKPDGIDTPMTGEQYIASKQKEAENEEPSFPGTR